MRRTPTSARHNLLKNQKDFRNLAVLSSFRAKTEDAKLAFIQHQRSQELRTSRPCDLWPFCKETVLCHHFFFCLLQVSTFHAFKSVLCSPEFEPPTREGMGSMNYKTHHWWNLLVVLVRFTFGNFSLWVVVVHGPRSCAVWWRPNLCFREVGNGIFCLLGFPILLHNRPRQVLQYFSSEPQNARKQCRLYQNRNLQQLLCIDISKCSIPKIKLLRKCFLYWKIKIQSRLQTAVQKQVLITIVFEHQCLRPAAAIYTQIYSWARALWVICKCAQPNGTIYLFMNAHDFYIFVPCQSVQKQAFRDSIVERICKFVCSDSRVTRCTTNVRTWAIWGMPATTLTPSSKARAKIDFQTFFQNWPTKS